MAQTSSPLKIQPDYNLIIFNYIMITRLVFFFHSQLNIDWMQLKWSNVSYWLLIIDNASRVVNDVGKRVAAGRNDSNVFVTLQGMNDVTWADYNVQLFFMFK